MATDDEVIRHFGSHFVSLAIEFCPVDSNGTFIRRAPGTGPLDRVNSVMCFSGFVMEVDHFWFLVTSGHILADIETQLRAGQEGILQSHLIDIFGPSPTHRTLIPINYQETFKHHEYDRATGTDFAFIYLRPLIRANLAANQIVPVDRRMWADVDDTEFERFFMVGLPTELIRYLTPNRRPGDGASIDLRMAMLPVEKMDALPDHLDPCNEPMFIGRVPSAESGVDNIDGMSGSPVIGVRRHPDGSAVYAVVAIQSSWYPNSRFVLAYPFPALARRMELELRTLAARFAETGSNDDDGQPDHGIVG
jgi:hypothetical protein